MKELLQRILRKRNIVFEELDKDEKKTFEEWDKTLSKEQLTIDDFKSFCQRQIEIIETKWADYSLEEKKKSDLIPYHTCYKTIQKVVDSPQKARESLERYLIQLLN